MNWIVPISLVLIAFIAFWAIGCYNRLQALRAKALLALAQHAAAIAARNEIIKTINDALASNLQHERALFSTVMSEVHRNTAVAETAPLSRGSESAMVAFDHSELSLQEKLLSLQELNAAYPELTVNEQLATDWQMLVQAVARCRFSAEQFNVQAAALNEALLQRPASALAKVFRLSLLAKLYIPTASVPAIASEARQASLLP